MFTRHSFTPHSTWNDTWSESNHLQNNFHALEQNSRPELSSTLTCWTFKGFKYFHKLAENKLVEPSSINPQVSAAINHRSPQWTEQPQYQLYQIPCVATCLFLCRVNYEPACRWNPHKMVDLFSLGGKRSNSCALPCITGIFVPPAKDKCLMVTVSVLTRSVFVILQQIPLCRLGTILVEM